MDLTSSVVYGGLSGRFRLIKAELNDCMADDLSLYVLSSFSSWDIFSSSF
jgi:hypothetical protein